MHYLASNKDYHHKDAAQHQDEQDKDASHDALLVDTIHYYDDCHNDYLFAWCNRQNLALHYGYWDDDKPYNHHQALLNTNHILYQQAQIKPSERILDAGCGLGGSAIWLATQHQNKVTGISISEKQVRYARDHAQRRQVSDLVDFEVADFCQTPFAEGSFDVIWALESACYALDKAAFLKEAYRLLAPGGRLALCDAFMLQRELDTQQWQTVQDFLQGWVVPNLSDRAEFTTFIAEAGFKDSHVRDISQQILPSSKHMYRTAKRLYPVQKISQWLGLRSATQTANYQVGFAQYDFFHAPLAEYCIFTATK